MPAFTADSLMNMPEDDVLAAPMTIISAGPGLPNRARARPPLPACSGPRVRSGSPPGASVPLPAPAPCCRGAGGSPPLVFLVPMRITLPCRTLKQQRAFLACTR
ncbi:hypothetical protein GCM10012287_19630 [Streptomyces daqingensis]|uniref:Uncharacterized protein n=1 Tax=Streptomyces daqingensis TaxID=1472640 RepID=A0ABQ2M8W7_9ACTN|nr:hypothetical protein GCM10012287_19630 [Streptomyces daqingensis]